jgi:high-affinity iron transporter
MNLKLFCLLIFFIAGIGHGTEKDASGRMIVHLLNYISTDYAGAVDLEGKILNQFEYDEQVEFAGTILSQAQSHEILRGSEIHESLKELNQLVLNRVQPQKVSDLAKDLSSKVIKKTSLVVEPETSADLESGKNLFAQNCSQCHGLTGAGDGPSSGNFNPPPTNFTDSKLQGLGPFHFYNVIKLGVPGTAMAAFDHFSEAEIWNLAFYVEVLKKGGESDKPSSENMFLAKAHRLLDQSVEAYQKQQNSSALQYAVSAYLDGVEPLEPKLRLKNSEFEIRLESSFLQVRKAIQNGASLEMLSELVRSSQSLLQEASQLLEEKKVSPWFVFSMSFGIFLREAFEAALLLITLLGVVRSFGSAPARYAVHGGWLLAMTTGIAAWFSSEKLLLNSGAEREFLEGSISLFAVLVLLFFGLWMHRQSEIGKWRGFIQKMVVLAKDKKNILILGGISFLGVFREVFETVLFLRALTLEANGDYQMQLLSGVGGAFVLVLILSAGSVKLSKKLPVRKLFYVSSGVMFLLCFILLGKGIHAFQEIGLIPITELGLNLRWDWAGIYPFYQTLIAQIILLLVIALLGRNPKPITGGLTKS